MAVDTKAFGVSVGVNTAVCAICLIIFSILRTNQITRKFYAPKRYAADVQHRPKRLPLGYVSWLLPVWRYPEDELIKVAGLDAAIFLRIMKFGVTIFFRLSLWCCIILIPINITDDNTEREMAKDPKHVSYSNIDKLYLTNVRAKSPRLWAHAISVYAVTYMVLSLLWQYNQDLSRLRVTFLSSVPKGGPTHTVLVTDVPGIRAGTVLDTICRLMNTSILRFAPKRVKDKVNNLIEATYGVASGGLTTLTSVAAVVAKRLSKEQEEGPSNPIDLESMVNKDVLDPEGAASDCIKSGVDSKTLIANEFTAVYGEEVVGVNPVYNQESLEPLVAKYESTKANLMDILDHYESRLKRRKPCEPKTISVVGPLLGAWGIQRYGMKPVKVDALEHHSAYLTELKRQIREGEPESKKDFYPSCFVTFKTRFTSSVAASSLHTQNEMTWRVQEAPGQDEIIWKNLRMRAWERSLRGLAMWALFITIILFYTIVCGALQSFVNIKQLKDTPVIKDIIALPFIESVIVSILPGIVLKIFLAILPMLLAYMSRVAGMVSTSQVDFAVVEKFFTFQVITVFLATSISGTLLTQFKAIMKNKDIWSVVSKIGEGIPQQATFFMAWVMLNGLAAKPIAFLRAVGLVIFWVLSKLAGTERAKTRLWANQEMMFGSVTTDHVMAILFGVVFCIQAPLITPVCLYYFVVQTMLEKYQALYVFGRPYESAGRLWAKIYRQIMVAVYIFQIVMILQLTLKQFVYVPLLVPVLVLTLIFDLACSGLFQRPWVVLSLRAAAELDRLDLRASGGVHLTPEEKEEIAVTYLSPVYKVSDEEYEGLMEETASTQRRMKGEHDMEAPSQMDDTMSEADSAIHSKPHASPDPLIKHRSSRL